MPGCRIKDDRKGHVRRSDSTLTGCEERVLVEKPAGGSRGKSARKPVCDVLTLVHALLNSGGPHLGCHTQGTRMRRKNNWTEKPRGTLHLLGVTKTFVLNKEKGSRRRRGAGRHGKRVRICAMGCCHQNSLWGGPIYVPIGR